MKINSLTPSLECLSDETVLIQAWKKTSNYIRYHNWFSDTLELDRTAVNLKEFISDLSRQIKSGELLLPAPIRIVPAPKSQEWKVHVDGRWAPSGSHAQDIKIRPLAHVNLRDQVIATAMMMCLADRLESIQGDPSTRLDSNKLPHIISYGNRLYSDFNNNKVRHRWGSGKFYRGFYEDYQTFLARPEFIAEKISDNYPRIFIVQSDLKQFYDRVTPSLMQEALRYLQKPEDDPRFYEVTSNFFSWKWSKDDIKDALKYSELSGIQDFNSIVLPQGLVSSGFFSNAILTKFDIKLREIIGNDILPGVRLHDASRYVDDLRFVMSVSKEEKVEEFTTKIYSWLQSILDVTAPGLILSQEKTLVSAFRAEERPILLQSKRMSRIQTAISGGFDPIAGGEILDSVLSLMRSQERLANAQRLNEHDPFRPVPDVRDSTVERFAAGRFRSTYRSLRPQLWQTSAELELADGSGSQFKGVRTRGELDDEMRTFSLELISKWVSDPSNVRLLRIALDLWPDASILKNILDLIRPYTQKGGPRKMPRRIAWYCLSEILRAGAVETGFVGDSEQLPSSVDVDEYRRVLREEALRVITTKETYLPWYLKQQAYLMLATKPEGISRLPKNPKGVLRPYSRLLKFLNNEADNWLSDEFATYAILARRSYFDVEYAVATVRPKLTHARLNKIFSLDPNFAMELILNDRINSYLTPRSRADLGIYASQDNQSTLGKIVLSPDTKNYLRTERNVLLFSKLFLTSLNDFDDLVAITPSDVTVHLNVGRGDVDQVLLSPRDLIGDSLYRPPYWAEQEEYWRFQLGFLIRFILTAQPDFTRAVHNPHWKETSHIYRPPSSHWYERIHGFYNGHSAFGDDWLPISEWMEEFLFKLLRWPGTVDQDLNNIEYTIESAKNEINNRINYLKDLGGESVSFVPINIPRTFQKDVQPLRGCVIQLVFPDKNDFNEDDLTMSDEKLRIKHRRHLSAALAAVKSALALRETHKSMDNRLDWLIMPELSVHPDDVKTHLVPFARTYKTIILTGLTYEEVFAGQPLVNSALWVIPVQHNTRGLQIRMIRQGKKHLAPMEKSYEQKGLVQSFRPCQWLIGYDWSGINGNEPLWLSAAICFDATDLKLAADLKDKSDVFAITALNKDIKTFDNMALALHYHMHQMVIVANNGNYGGSNAYAPYKIDREKQVFHMHGQPQASIAFFELEDISKFKGRRSDLLNFKPYPAG
ncbi:RNA-directed DNA polymerase [Erwiniaceae bacterium L1_54_3]|nr:RNA-directed DNA polymerase [Erwiniaceae bacterium L1_54_3]